MDHSTHSEKSSHSPIPPSTPPPPFTNHDGHHHPHNNNDTVTAPTSTHHPMPNNNKGLAHQQQQQQQQPTYNTALPLSALTRHAAPVDCPSCHTRALTNTEFESGNVTHAWAAALCVLTCLGCIPYCVRATKDVRHACSKCGTPLAIYHRSGNTEVLYYR